MTVKPGIVNRRINDCKTRCCKWKDPGIVNGKVNDCKTRYC